MKKLKEIITSYNLCIFTELFTDVNGTAEMAQSISDSQGVCFIPGLQVKILLITQSRIYINNPIKIIFTFKSNDLHHIYSLVLRFLLSVAHHDT